MEKTTSIIIEEAKCAIADVINAQNLHPAILELVLKDLYNQAKDNATKQLIFEQREYQKATEKDNEEQDT